MAGPLRKVPGINCMRMRLIKKLHSIVNDVIIKRHNKPYLHARNKRYEE